MHRDARYFLFRFYNVNDFRFSRSAYTPGFGRKRRLGNAFPPDAAEIPSDAAWFRHMPENFSTELLTGFADANLTNQGGRTAEDSTTDERGLTRIWERSPGNARRGIETRDKLDVDLMRGFQYDRGGRTSTG